MRPNESKSAAKFNVGTHFTVKQLKTLLNHVECMPNWTLIMCLSCCLLFRDITPVLATMLATPPLAPFLCMQCYLMCGAAATLTQPPDKVSSTGGLSTGGDEVSSAGGNKVWSAGGDKEVVA